MSKNIFKSQSGMVPIVEVVLLILVVAVLGFAGYRVYTERHPAPKPADAKVAKKATQSSVLSLPPGPVEAPANLTYSDSKNVFTVHYPSNWTMEKHSGHTDTLGEVEGVSLISNQLVDYYKNQRGFVSVGDSGEVGVLKVVSSLSPEDWYKSVNNGSTIKGTSLTINGYPAYYLYNKANDAYADQTYVVSHGGVVAYMYFKQMDGSVDFSAYQPLFEAIVHSIKFSN